MVTPCLLPLPRSSQNESTSPPIQLGLASGPRGTCFLPHSAGLCRPLQPSLPSPPQLGPLGPGFNHFCHRLQFPHPLVLEPHFPCPPLVPSPPRHLCETCAAEQKSCVPKQLGLLQILGLPSSLSKQELHSWNLSSGNASLSGNSRMAPAHLGSSDIFPVF